MGGRIVPPVDSKTNFLRDRVKGFLVAAGISQNELARRCGTSPQRMQQILDGDSMPSLALALRFEDITGISARTFCQVGGEKDVA